MTFASQTLTFKPRRGSAVPLMCEGARHREPGRRLPNGRSVALIMGRPAIVLCMACRREWERAWADASGVSERAAA